MSDRQLVTFEVVAADAAAEIYLIDGDFRLVKKGVGRETFTVPAGIYKIKNRTGRTTAEQLVVVQEGLSRVDLDPVVISSTMPLVGSAWTHEYHMSAATNVANGPKLSLGSGSSIVIIARQWSGQTPRTSPDPPPNPARGLSLLTKTGTLVADVAALTTVVGMLDPIVTLDIELAAGPYRLSLARADGRRVEQTLIASPGWQTQVHLLVIGPEDEAARVDLITAAITLRKLGQPFAADDPILRAEAIARGALRDSHKILSDEMRAQFTNTTASPMLALIGAHLLVRDIQERRRELAETPNGDTRAIDRSRAELNTIVGTLRNAIGRHPDVEAVATMASGADTDFVFDVPPMFRQSWPLLLDLSVKRPTAIPVASLISSASERIWGEGTWLQWLAAGTHDVVDRAALWQAKARDLLASFQPTAPAPTAPASEPTAAAMTTTAAAIETAIVVTPRSAVNVLLHTLLHEGRLIMAAVDSVFTPVSAPLIRKAQTLFAARSRTPFPLMIEGNLSNLAEPSSTDLGQALTALTDEHRAQLVKHVGVPLSKIEAWLGQTRSDAG